MWRTSAALLAVGVTLTISASLMSARRAEAFCRTTTSSIDPSFVATPDHPCWDDGMPLFWKNACVGYSIQQDASKQVSFNDAQTSMETAFAEWTSATCPTANDTASSKASIDVRFLGPVACHKVQYNSGSGNSNTIMFDDGTWPHNDSNNTLGLTTVTYNINTGELYDADMELNTAQQSLTVNGDVPSDGFDLLSIVTHESGHFLGLAHSQDTHATMFAHYTQGATSMRSLSADDVQGICSVYAPDGTRMTATGAVPEGPCDPTPRHGYSGVCGSSGCSAAPGPTSGGFGVLAVMLGLVRRRRAGRA